MNTSAEPPSDAVGIERDAFRIERRPYTDPAVAELVRAVQAEYVVRYGGPDESPMDAAQFDPPVGVFLVGLIRSTPVACGGWRSYDDVGVEIKRMFVVSSARRRGYAARILAALEEYARRAGKTQIRLETGTAQPEAVAMYQRLGYEPVEPFGYYRCAPQSVHLGKSLAGG